MTNSFGLDHLGFTPKKEIFHNLTVDELITQSLQRGEGVLAENKALVVSTGARTGRSPKDRFVVQDVVTQPQLWWGSVNQPITPEVFERQWKRALEHLSQRDLFLFDGFAGADKKYRLPVRVVTEKAWQSLFARTLFLRPTKE